MTDMDMVTKWSDGYVAGTAIGAIAGFVVGLIVGWVLKPGRRDAGRWPWSGSRSAGANWATINKLREMHDLPPLRYQVRGNVTKSREPTTEEKKQGVERVVEGVELHSVSLVSDPPNPECRAFLCENWHGKGCKTGKLGPCTPACDGWSRKS